MRRSRQQAKHQLQRCSKRRHPETPVEPEDEAAISKDKGAEEQGSRFFGCYLLTSLSPRHKGHTYIGFTVNPQRRIRQHNGEITSGAFSTKRKRPWEMVLCIHGFPTQVAALQFEWAWQHPKESLAVREVASTFKSLGGLANKIKLGITMLILQSWRSMDLTVSFFSTKYMSHTAGCPSLPRQMKIHFCSMDELPCYWGGDQPYGCDNEDDVDSNHAEEFAGLSDDRQGSSIDGAVVNMSPSSIDIERSNIQNVSEEIWTWNHRGLTSSLQEESSPLVAGVEKDEQLRQSLPAGVLPGNNIEEFSRTDSHKELPSHPLLEEEMERHCEFPAGNPWWAGRNMMNEQIQLSKEMEGDRVRDSFPPLEDLTEPFDRADLCTGESSLTVAAGKAKKDNVTVILIDESTEEQRHPTYEQLPVTVKDDNIRPSSMEGIEIIDLFTPSPESNIASGSKKRRRTAHDHPDIIDLTRSPHFVQL